MTELLSTVALSSLAVFFAVQAVKLFLANWFEPLRSGLKAFLVACCASGLSLALLGWERPRETILAALAAAGAAMVVHKLWRFLSYSADGVILSGIKRP